VETKNKFNNSILSQDLPDGTAEPIRPEENLDVLAAAGANKNAAGGSSGSKESSFSGQNANNKYSGLGLTTDDDALGLSLMSKLFFAGLIVAGCVLFVRTRKNASASGGLYFKAG
jgi:hypothetical protein